jgi:hypothetical protein
VIIGVEFAMFDAMPAIANLATETRKPQAGVACGFRFWRALRGGVKNSARRVIAIN